MKTLLIITSILICAISVSAQTVRLQQRNASGQWTTVQTQNGTSGSLTKVAAGNFRICVETNGTSSCAENDGQGKSLTIPQTSSKTVTQTFRIDKDDWKLTLQIQGTTVGWNWGRA